MALGFWPCNFPSTFLREDITSSRSLIRNSTIVLISGGAPRGPFKALQFKSFRGRAAGKENFETKEKQGRISKETNVSSNSKQSVLQGEDSLKRVSMAKDAEEALAIIAEKTQGNDGVVSSEDCTAIITAALAQNNFDLAFSILHAMRRNSIQRNLQKKLGEESIYDSSIQTWRWPQPDVTTYTALVRGLAASLRVSDAIRTIKDISCVGSPPGDEVPFGKVVKCPNCLIALAVVQPQHGIQLVSCSKCRYQYELMSGDIINIESESIRICSLANAAQTIQYWKRG